MEKRQHSLEYSPKKINKLKTAKSERTLIKSLRLPQIFKKNKSYKKFEASFLEINQ